MNTFGESDSPALQEVLNAIDGWSNEVTAIAEDSDHRCRAALSLLKIAMRATSELHRVWREQEPGFCDDVIECFHEISPDLLFWPVPYNDTADLEPYRRLRIGHNRIDSKSPHKRTGNTVFSHCARLVVNKIRFLQAAAQAEKLGDKWEHYATHIEDKARLDLILALAVASNGAKPPTLWMTINAYQPPDLKPLADLPPLSEASAAKWKQAAKRFVKGAMPQPERFDDLAKQINDKEVVRESQIRAQIVERIGRAVVALARKR